MNSYSTPASSDRRGRPALPASGRAQGSLGTNYEITAPPNSLSRDTFSSNQALRRLKLYQDQAVAREIVPEYRVSHCLRSMNPGVRGVEIWKSLEKAHYKNLQVCGSVWVCPVCAAKISERRREELVKAIKTWENRGGSVLMASYTVPHYAHQPLREVLEKFSKSRYLMHHRKPWKKLAGLAIAGNVRALEVTWGCNGWHVHCHEILFIKPETPYQHPLRWQAAIYMMWASACRSAGLNDPSMKHGVQVQDGQYAGKYAAKWGMECELTKGHIKHARGDNYSPWDMLRQYGEGRHEFGERFQEYAKAFHGKRQLVWSDGLRKLLGLGEESTDEELAIRAEEDAVFLGLLTRDYWHLVVQVEKRGELLQVAESEGWQGVKEYIRKLVKKQQGKEKWNRSA